MIRRVAVTCPHCGNSDQRLIELSLNVLGVLTRYFCVGCRRTFDLTQ